MFQGVQGEQVDRPPWNGLLITGVYSADMKKMLAGPLLSVRAAAVVALFVLPSGAGAVKWLGADATTGGFGVRAGTSVLRVPLVGAVGVEGSLEKAWRGVDPGRYALGVTLRDLNLPLTRVDAFATVGAEYRSRLNLYAEGGLRGPVFGPAGWRAFVRANSAAQIGAGIGLELRF